MTLTGRSQKVEEPAPKAKAVDLFDWFNALYTKQLPTGTPPTFMMHRFMASDPDLAQFARSLQQEVREPLLVFNKWQGLLPVGRSAPRWGYVVPKKLPEEEDLITKMKAVLSERRDVCEKMVEIVRLAGKEKELYYEFGIKPPGEKEVKSAAPKPAPKPQGGLLVGLKR